MAERDENEVFRIDFIRKFMTPSSLRFEGFIPMSVTTIGKPTNKRKP